MDAGNLSLYAVGVGVSLAEFVMLDKGSRVAVALNTGSSTKTTVRDRRGPFVNQVIDEGRRTAVRIRTAINGLREAEEFLNADD